MNALHDQIHAVMQTLFQRNPALCDLVEDEPEAAELLRGRTLARSFH